MIRRLQANRSSPLDFISPGWIHRVVLAGLPPSTTIYYRVSTRGGAMSAEASFTSRKPAAADAVKFIMYGEIHCLLHSLLLRADATTCHPLSDCSPPPPPPPSPSSSLISLHLRRRRRRRLDLPGVVPADQALPVELFAPAWRLVGQVVEDLKNGYDGFLLHPGDLGYAEGSGFIW